MITKLLKHLYRQPKNVRNNYAFGIATVFTGVVALVWLVSSPKQDFIPLNISEGKTPFSNLLKQSKEQLASLKSAVSESTEGVLNDQETKTEVTGNASSIILSEEDIGIINENNQLAPATSSDNQNQDVETNPNNDTGSATSSQSIYQEVQIITTSASQINSTSTTPDYGF